MYEDFALFLPYCHVSVFRIQQVGHLLQVYLVERKMNCVGGKSSLVLKVFKQILERVRNNTLSSGVYLLQNAHRMGFTCTCLTVDKISSVEAI